MQSDLIMVLDAPIVLVPLHAQDGSTRAFAIIDEADAAFVSQWTWHLGSGGYAIRNDRSQGGQYTILLHRALLGLPRVADGREGDHINRNRLDDRRANLRIVPSGTNMQNKSRADGYRADHRGVTLYSPQKRWQARITVDGKRVSLGYFKTQEEAAEVARAGRARLMPYAVD